MDLTPMILQRLVLLHPNLTTVPNDAPDGLDSLLPPAPPIDWSRAGTVLPNDDEIRQNEENLSDDEEEHDRVHRVSWSDWSLCIGAEIMDELRREIWTRLHYTCSAGVAHNKAMAKVGRVWMR
jgi:DNA polymerase eta